MKFFYAPGACSIGIHVLLEEIGKPYEAVRSSTSAPATPAKPPFTEINPKGKVPTIQRDDGSVITEYPGRSPTSSRQANPEANLLPKSPEAELVGAEAMDYCVATIHMQGFSRLFRPANFAPNEADHEAVKARGRELVEKGFASWPGARGQGVGRRRLLGRRRRAVLRRVLGRSACTCSSRPTSPPISSA